MEVFDYSDEFIDDDLQVNQVWTDMDLRVEAKTLMLRTDSEEWLSPRKRAEIQRTLGHVVFELAYRTGTMQDYIQFHKEAVILDAA